MQIFTEPSVYRDISLAVYGAVYLFGIQFIIRFLSDWRHSKILNWRDIRIAWASFIAMAIIHLFFFMIGDFYATSELEREFFIKIGYNFLLLGLTIFAIVFEASYKKSHHIFSILFFIGFIATFLVSHTLLKVLAVAVFSPILIVELIIFSKFMLKYAFGKIKISIITLLLSFILVLIGYAFMADFAIESLGLISYTVGSIVIAAGIIGMGHALTNIPSFDELNWKDMITTLYIMTKTGLPIVKLNFQNVSENIQDSDILAAGGFTGIRELLKEISSKGEVRVVDQGDVKLIFANSEHFISILVTKKALGILYEKLDDLTKRFEMIYGDMITKWDGNMSVFGPARKIAAITFGVSATELAKS